MFVDYRLSDIYMVMVAIHEGLKGTRGAERKVEGTDWVTLQGKGREGEGGELGLSLVNIKFPRVTSRELLVGSY